MRKTTATVAVLIALLLLPVTAHVVLAAAPGFASFVVVGGSMEPTIDRGSLVYVQDTDDYGPGDVITFSRDDRIVTHRIVSETEGGYVTRGDGNRGVDEWRISERRVVGEVVLAVPVYGHLLTFVGVSIGFMAVVLIPGIVLVGLETYHLVAKL